MKQEYPPDGTWCWVRRNGDDWFPAERDEDYAGGWGNADTWEDFDEEIAEWIVLPLPPEGRVG